MDRQVRAVYREFVESFEEGNLSRCRRIIQANPDLWPEKSTFPGYLSYNHSMVKELLSKSLRGQ